MLAPPQPLKGVPSPVPAATEITVERLWEKVLGRAPILFHLDGTSAERWRDANKRLQLTPYSLRFAAASGRS